MPRRTLLLAVHSVGFAVLATAVVASIASPGASGHSSLQDFRDAAAERMGVAPERVGVFAPEVLQRTADVCEVIVPIEGHELRAVLSRHSLRAPGFRLRIQDASGRMREETAPVADTWRGAVQGEPGSRVVAARSQGQWRMRIVHAAPGGAAEAWAVSPLSSTVPGAPRELSLVAREADSPSEDGTCAVERAANGRRAAAGNAGALTALAPSAVLVCEIACDTDVEYFVANGSSVSATVADMEAVMALTSDIFEFDLQMTLRIVNETVRTAEPDPYTTTNPYALLEDLRREWQANGSGVSRDIVHLITGHDLDGTTIGIAYGDPGVCNYYAYSIAQTLYSTTMARRAALSAHELGHNFDAVHCDYDDYTCRIMCASMLKCAVGNHSFGPSEVARIRSHMATLTCLEADTIDVPHASLPFADAFPGIAPDAAKWTSADQVYVNYGYLQVNHGGGYSPEFYLGTIRTLPIVMTGRATISFKARSINVPVGQHLKVEYFHTSNRAWVMLHDIVAPGGTTAYATYVDTLPSSAAGEWFALRFSAWGSSGSTSTDWYVDDVAIGQTTLDAPGERALFSRFGPAFPNPATGRAALGFAIRRDSHLRVTVFSVDGARVRTLFDGARAAGSGTLVWDGRDDRGGRVPAGIYVARFEAGGEARSARFAILR